jgi:hypothetical protein
MVAVQAAGGTASVRFGWTVPATALIATAAGVLRGVRALTPTPVARSTSSGIGDDVKTSFGVGAVEFVRRVDGIRHRALSGATHGVSGLVESGSQQIRSRVALINRGQHPLSCPVRQFELLVTTAGKTSVRPATAGALRPVRTS